MKNLTGWQGFFIVIGVIAVIFIILNWNKIFGNGSNGNGTANGTTRSYRVGGIGGFTPGFTPGTTPVTPVTTVTPVAPVVPSIQPYANYDLNQRALSCGELENGCLYEYNHTNPKSTNGIVCTAWKTRCLGYTSGRTADEIIIERASKIVTA